MVGRFQTNEAFVSNRNASNDPKFELSGSCYSGTSPLNSRGRERIHLLSFIASITLAFPTQSFASEVRHTLKPQSDAQIIGRAIDYHNQSMKTVGDLVAFFKKRTRESEWSSVESALSNYKGKVPRASWRQDEINILQDGNVTRVKVVDLEKAIFQINGAVLNIGECPGFNECIKAITSALQKKQASHFLDLLIPASGAIVDAGAVLIVMGVVAAVITEVGVVAADIKHAEKFEAVQREIGIVTNQCQTLSRGPEAAASNLVSANAPINQGINQKLASIEKAYCESRTAAQFSIMRIGTDNTFSKTCDLVREMNACMRALGGKLTSEVVASFADSVGKIPESVWLKATPVESGFSKKATTAR